VLHNTSFQCIAFSLAGQSQLLVILIYRPPKTSTSASTTLMYEFSELLTSICSRFPSTLLLGDFNIHVDSSTCTFATEFLSLLDCFNITHVQGPTHTKGHTLDLVCSVGTTPTQLQSLDLAVADHLAVQFAILIPLPSRRIKWTITFRNTRTVCAPALTSIIASHLTPYAPNTLVDSLDSALSLSLNVLTPLKTRTVSYSRPASCFTAELRTMKAAGRWLERLQENGPNCPHGGLCLTEWLFPRPSLSTTPP